MKNVYQVTHGSSICLPGSAIQADSFVSVFSTQFPAHRRCRCSSGGSQPPAVGGLICDDGGLSRQVTLSTSDVDVPDRATARWRSSTVGWGGNASSWARESLTSRSWRTTARRAAAELLTCSSNSCATDVLAKYRRYDCRPWISASLQRNHNAAFDGFATSADDWWYLVFWGRKRRYRRQLTKSKMKWQEQEKHAACSMYNSCDNEIAILFLLSLFSYPRNQQQQCSYI